MAVYKRGYQRYTGPVTGEWTRLLAFPRFAWRRLLGQRLVIIALMISILPVIVAATFIYLGNHQELWRGLRMGEEARLLDPNGSFFLIFTNAQAALAVMVAALTGPGLIAPDLANGGLPLYFSRPLTRRDYVLARLIVLMGLLSLLTWIPGLLLFLLQSTMAGGDWAVKNWNIGAGIAGGQMIWITFVSLVALAASAWVKWRIIAGALILALFFVTAGAGGVINAVFRERWGMYLNPAINMSNLWREFFGLDLPEGLDAGTSAICLALMAAGFVWALSRKLRPVEVVR
jgi:ABC-2 type transport system permease protein